MKKILVTEKQLDRLVSFILEADTPADAEKSKAEDEKKKKQFLEEIRGEFKYALRGAKKCDDLLIWFGEVDKEEKWVRDSLKMVAFRILSKGKDGFTLKPLEVKGDLPFNKDRVYMIYLKDCFNIEDNGAYLKFYILNSELKTNEKPDVERDISVYDFLSFEVKENNENCKKPLSNLNDITLEQAKKYTAQVDKILQSIEYTPGLLGMNNIFFFPKGFQAMDDILSKYGLRVKKDIDEDGVVFNILEKPKKGSFEKNTHIEGIINFKNDIEVREWLFEVPDGQEIKKDEEFDVAVYKVTKTTKILQFRTRIKILETGKDVKLSKTEIDPEETPKEKPEETPETPAEKPVERPTTPAERPERTGDAQNQRNSGRPNEPQNIQLTRG